MSGKLYTLCQDLSDTLEELKDTKQEAIREEFLSSVEVPRVVLLKASEVVDSLLQPFAPEGELKKEVIFRQDHRH